MQCGSVPVHLAKDLPLKQISMYIISRFLSIFFLLLIAKIGLKLVMFDKVDSEINTTLKFTIKVIIRTG